jgi:tetratricopeptide repeat protein 30
LAKHTLILKDSVFQEVLEFFDNCELYGRDIPVVIDPLAGSQTNLMGDSSDDFSSNSISSEARYLKGLFLKLYE